MREHEMVGWHHQFKGHEFEQTLGDGEGGQGSLACCCPWGHKESDMTSQVNIWTKNFLLYLSLFLLHGFDSHPIR